MKNEFMLNFHLFDGEGGDGGTADASSSNQAQEPVRIEYGKPQGNGSTPGQVGSDKGGQSEDLSAEFAEMIGKGGRYHDIYGQMVQQAVQNRFKNQADLQGQVNQITEDLSPLFVNYGLAPGDYEGLKDALAKDESFYKSAAEKAGIDVDTYKQLMKYKADSERLSQVNEAFKAQQARNQMYQQWESEAAQLQQVFPSFDLAAEIENNEKFADLLDKGISVKDAFVTAHLDEILTGNNSYQQRTATQNVVNSIHQRASRPAEGALSHAPAIERRSDPSTLTDEDFDEINRQVALGKTFAF